MTISLDNKAFDAATAHPLKVRQGSADESRGRIASIIVTVGLHLAVAVGLVASVHVVSIKIPPALMVHISPELHKLDQTIMPPPPQLQIPQMMAVPVPEFQVQVAPSPIVVQQQPVAAPAPPPAAAAMGVPKGMGEGKDNFNGRLLAYLSRFKQYPRAARQAHIQGVVMLHFVMDANGMVLSAEIAKSSGYAVLDAEALALVRRAQPLPALPAGFPTPTLNAVIPIEFFLDR